jgi:hypothetical protein
MKTLLKVIVIGLILVIAGVIVFTTFQFIKFKPQTITIIFPININSMTLCDLRLED